MEVTKTIANSQKTTSQLSLKNELEGLTKSQKEELLGIVGELLVEQVLLSCAESQSPVEGEGKFKKLSKGYAELKEDETGSDAPNLDLTGEMLGALDFKIIGDKIEIGVFGEDAGKADGHNNFSGKSKLPQRRFLPDKGQEFNGDIRSLIDDTINTFIADNTTLEQKKLKEIETTKDLYSFLREEFGELTRSELKSLVLKSPLAVQLQDFDLLDLL